MTDTAEAKARSREVPLREYFGFSRIPFSEGLRDRDLFLLPSLVRVTRDVAFATDNQICYAVIGEIGSGKSTALGHACAALPSRNTSVIRIVAGSWGYTEFLRALLAACGHEVRSFLPSMMARTLRLELLHTCDQGRRTVIAIDEAHLLRNEAFSQMHTLIQNPDSGSPLASIILCGEESLADRLNNPAAKPLASRILDGYFMKPITQDVYEKYFRHHLAVAGAPEDLFDQVAIDAIWQSSSRNLRKIGITARRCLQIAADQGLPKVSAAVVRDATRSWWENSLLLPGASNATPGQPD